MHKSITATSLLLLALAGCDGGAPRESGTVTSVKASSPYVDQLKTLNAFNRGLALRRAIQDSGSTCKSVDSSGYQQEHANMSMWTARCSEGVDWALFIAPNGDVQVRDCADAPQLDLPACRVEEAA